MNICHIQMNHDEVKSLGVVVNSKPAPAASIAHNSRMPYESEVIGHSRFALNQVQNRPWHMLQMYPPLLTTNSSTFTSRDWGNFYVWAE